MEMAIPNAEITGTTTVKPFSPLPRKGRPYLNTLETLTVFDLASYNCHIPTIYAFHPPMPTNETLMQALGEALFHYPHLAGTLISDAHGHPSILLDDHGVRVVETKVPTPLRDHLPLDPSTNLMNLVPQVADPTRIFQVQLNRFGCGRVAIGQSFHHHVADGVSIAAFLNTWANMVTEPGSFKPYPYHGRTAVSIPRNPPACEYPHGEIEFRKRNQEPSSSSFVVSASPAKVRIVSVRFSKDFLQKLKERAIASGGGENGRSRCSTFSCVLAHVWKTAIVARGIGGGDSITRVRVAVNGRTRVRPPVPTSYFGNYVLWAFPAMRASELMKATYGEVVAVIRKAVEEVDDGYVKSFIDFGEMMRRGEAGGEMVETLPSVGGAMRSDLEFNCWLGLGFEELDFGGGRPCAFVPPSLPVEGLTILLPSCEEEGGANVCTSLLEKHAATFEELCYALE